MGNPTLFFEKLIIQGRQGEEKQMNFELINALKQIEKERNIPFNILLEAIELALSTAYKKNFGTTEDVNTSINRQNGQMRVFIQKNVVEEVLDPAKEITLNDAKKIDHKTIVENTVEIEVTPTNFGRIAAQTAKQVIVQRIREAEKDIIYEEYSKKVGQITNGTIQRYEQKNILVDLGKTEGIIPPSEQVPNERYHHGDRLKFYILEIAKTAKGPQIILSRSHPALVRKLFELEVPEIHQNLIEIINISREAGYRSKISVKSNDPKIDPVGACVGSKGSRVQNIVEELKKEKIDIINYNGDPKIYISNALSPAKVKGVHIFENLKYSLLIVADDQLSLAIGKDGQNVRLASKLTGWKIDIKSETQSKDIEIKPPPELLEEEKKKEKERKAKEKEEEKERKAKEKEEKKAKEKEKKKEEKAAKKEEIQKIKTQPEKLIEEKIESAPEEEIQIKTETTIKFDEIPEYPRKDKNKNLEEVPEIKIKKDTIEEELDAKAKKKKKRPTKRQAQREEFDEDEFLEYYR